MSISLINTLLQADEIEIGAKAPAIESLDHEGKRVNLGEALSKGTVLVFFYPKAMTPGCTKQACSLRDGWDDLQKRKITVFGVSSDTPKTQAEFRDKQSLPFTLIADTDKAVAKAFGKGRWSRQAYIFQDGVLVWRDLSASTDGQMEDVINALEKLKVGE
ncbi:MAG: peroxiredoxin [Opitutales bacterium]